MRQGHGLRLLRGWVYFTKACLSHTSSFVPFAMMDHFRQQQYKKGSLTSVLKDARLLPCLQELFLFFQQWFKFFSFSQLLLSTPSSSSLPARFAAFRSKSLYFIKDGITMSSISSDMMRTSMPFALYASRSGDERRFFHHHR